MRRLLPSAVLLALLPLGVTSAAAEPSGGYLLQDTDAAYVDFTYEGDCNVFVGYVRTDRFLRFGDPGGFLPNTDVEVKLTGTCGPAEGVVNVADAQASFTTLDHATVSGVEVPLDDGGEATVTLDWTATGDVITWKQTAPGSHASHETRAALLEGTVTITKDTTTWMVDQDDAVSGSDPLESPRITFYNEVQAPQPAK